MRTPKEFGLPPFAHSFTVPTQQMDEDFLRWIQQNCVISTEAEWLKLNAELDRLRRELAETEQKRIDEWLVSEVLRRELAEAQSKLNLAEAEVVSVRHWAERELAEARAKIRNVANCLDTGMSPRDCATELRLIAIDAAMAEPKEVPK